MARIVFSAPPVDSEQTRSFRTHASYIRAFRELALGESTLSLEDAVAVFMRLRRRSCSRLTEPPAPATGAS
ncbi:hypothetical protein ACIPIC_35735 [Streptomyces collinus]|uniref:hypothetical protein n=1 Tax=Streptomyces collinus TaxID=42684 RepID=UPI00382FC211